MMRDADDRQDGRNQDQVKVQQIFAGDSEVGVTAPDYFNTRVIARVDERRANQSQKSVFWKGFGLAASLFVAIAIAGGTWMWLKSAAGTLEAPVGDAVVLQVDLADYQKYDVATLLVELPDGVQYFSKTFPDIARLRTLQLNWGDLGGRSHLDLMIKSGRSGLQTIKVKMLGKDGALLNEREVQVRFSQKGMS